MGELIYLTAHRAERDGHRPDALPTFFFDVSDPLSYLMAEQVERSLGEVHWVAVDGTALRDRAGDQEGLREQAEARAQALGVPLVWPETFPASTPCALRVAAFACEIGAGPQFALAASRLAFCGGFDLEDPEILTEAAAAAGVELDSCLEAAGERWRDGELAEMADVLREHDVFELPAVSFGGRWFAGDDALERAAANTGEPPPTGAQRTAPHWNRRPLAPVG